MATYDWSKLAPFVQAVKKACGTGVMAMGVVVKTDVQKSFVRTQSRRAGPAGGTPSRQRGKLHDSIQVAMGGEMVARVGSNLKYADVHEFGVPSVQVPEIRAKNVKYLPIPMNDAAIRLRQSGATQSLKVLGTFRFFTSRKGNLIMVGSNGKRAGLYKNDANGKRIEVISKNQPMFVLKKSVRIPKRPFMAPALARSHNNPNMTRTFSTKTTGALKAAGVNVKVVPA